MAPMQEISGGVNEKEAAVDCGSKGGADEVNGGGTPPLERQISNGWSFVFQDPTFGGECPHIPMRSKRPSQEWNVAPLITEALPAGVQEMLLGGTPEEDESPAAAGSGAKAAEYLRRLSNDSGSGLSGSGLSDGSSFGADTPRDQKKPQDKSGLSDSESGFSDVSDKEEEGDVKFTSERSQNSKKSKGGTKQSADGNSDNLENSSASLPSPDRQNRRADTIVPEKKENEGGGEADADSDLLSNPFATDSEDDDGKPMDSARSMKSTKSGRSAGGSGSKSGSRSGSKKNVPTE